MPYPTGSASWGRKCLAAKPTRQSYTRHCRRESYDRVRHGEDGFLARSGRASSRADAPRRRGAVSLAEMTAACRGNRERPEVVDRASLIQVLRAHRRTRPSPFGDLRHGSTRPRPCAAPHDRDHRHAHTPLSESKRHRSSLAHGGSSRAAAPADRTPMKTSADPFGTADPCGNWRGGACLEGGPKWVESEWGRSS